MKGRRRVGRRHAVAGVAADGAGVSDLGAAHHVDSFSEDVYILLNDRVARNMREGREASDADGLVFVHADAADFIQTLNRNQFFSRALSLSHLHENVRAARDDLGFRVRKAQLDGVLNACRFIERFHIIHSLVPLLCPFVVNEACLREFRV